MKSPYTHLQGAAQGRLKMTASEFPFEVGAAVPFFSQCPPTSTWPLLPSLLALLHEKMAASSFLHCNYCFTVECLNNSLQILCIYVELFTSYLLCLGSLSFPGGWF